jgi:hypothetical protein
LSGENLISIGQLSVAAVPVPSKEPDAPEALPANTLDVDVAKLSFKI